MNPNMTPNLMAVLPTLIIMVTGMVVLIGDSCLKGWKSTKSLSAIVTLIGIAAAGFFALSRITEDSIIVFGGAVVIDSFSNGTALILLATAAFATLLAMTYLENKNLNLGEYYALVLFSTSGSMLMASANDLIVLFIAIEILSVALYVLAGFARTDEKSEESALKYFLLGAFAAGFLLYGIALIYGGTAGAAGNGGTTNLTLISEFLRHTNGAANPMLMAGIALLLVGLGFKAGLVPFHMWTPDVYEGAPTSVTAYMAAGAKIGAFAAIVRVFNAFIPISPYWLIALQVLAVLTMFGGNLLAIVQENVKRMLAYSSIAHAGYLLVGVCAMAGNPRAHDTALGAILFYLFGYMLVTMGSFGILIWLSKRGHDCTTMNDLKGLAKTDPTAAYTMLIFMLSLAGIPLTVGFFGKLQIFNASLMAGQVGIAISMAVASIISVYYYLKVVWTMCFQEPDGDTVEGRATSSFGVNVTVGLSAIGCLLFGILPQTLQFLINASNSIMRP